MPEKMGNNINHVPVLEGRNYPLWSILINVELSAPELWDVCSSELSPTTDPSVINNWNQLNVEAVQLILSRLHPEIIVTVVNANTVKNAKLLWTKIHQKFSLQTVTNRGRTWVIWECLLNGNIEEYVKECLNILFDITGIGIVMPPDIMAYSILRKISRDSSAYDHIIDSMVLIMNSSINPLALDKLSELQQHKSTKDTFQKGMKTEKMDSSALFTNSSDYPYKLTYFFKNKSDAYKEFVKQKLIKNTHDRKIKQLLTDGGGEFVNQQFKDLENKHGFTHIIAPPYTPEHNGIAERANRTILDKAQCLLLTSNLPNQYWAEEINTATFLTNILPTPLKKNLSPYFLWTTQLPKIKRIHTFGCKVIFLIPKQRRLWKLGSVGEEGVLLGFNNDSSYRILKCKDGKVYCSRHAMFFENKFPILKNPKESDVPLLINSWYNSEEEEFFNCQEEIGEEETHNEESLISSDENSSDNNYEH
ncbi:hypothetical protein O181_066448 [Austropuccinia psidii MF-1]|uniref:Integrase catalytic domain-containing protein n=1 Tax=Austropuccinia psidii MF-1 TaxID=1389203 RepID=A0A9Q3I3L8_9BASI|nr:hypothetical protein [Austropuccinia psidii MF-1]